ncbi:MAG: DUF433 domain-containing protein [Planctomycetales bacterium]|nr:DUF433 domain-containing protein [Planctomycetales bacterium]
MQPAVTPHIESRPDKCGGRPCIAGTRIRVHDIYVWRVLGGQTALDILANKPELSLAAIHAAISYAFDHREELEGDIAGENAAYEQLKTATHSKTQDRLNAAGGSA